MKLNQLTADIQGEGGDALVSGFAIDHRKVAPGTIFGAFQGARVHCPDRDIACPLPFGQHAHQATVAQSLAHVPQ